MSFLKREIAKYKDVDDFLDLLNNYHFGFLTDEEINLKTEICLALKKFKKHEKILDELIKKGFSKFIDKEYDEAEQIFLKCYERPDSLYKKYTETENLFLRKCGYNITQFENRFVCRNLAETKYKLKKYAEAIYYWEKFLNIHEEELIKSNMSDYQIEKMLKESNKTTVQNVGVAYRKLLKSVKNTGKSTEFENKYKQFLNKYTKPPKSIIVDEKSFTIQHSNNPIPLKLIKRIETKKITGYVKFIDNGLLYTDGSKKPYNLVKININSEVEWKIPCPDGIRGIYCFNQSFLIHTTQWGQEENSSSDQTILSFISENGDKLNNFKFDSYVKHIEYNSNFVVIWSADSKIRIFNTVGNLLWEFNVVDFDKYDILKNISVSDTGLLLFNSYDKMYLVDENRKESLVCSVNDEYLSNENYIPVNDYERLLQSLNDEDLNDLTMNVDVNEYDFCISATVSSSISINGAKICQNSKCLLFWLDLFKAEYYLYCFNLNKELIWKIKLSFQIFDVDSFNDGRELLVSCYGTNGSTHFYFIEKGVIINECDIESDSGKLPIIYHNKKELFSIIRENEILMFDKIGNLLNKIVFGTDVISLDISEKYGKLVVATRNCIYLFNL